MTISYARRTAAFIPERQGSELGLEMHPFSENDTAVMAPLWPSNLATFCRTYDGAQMPGEHNTGLPGKAPHGKCRCQCKLIDTTVGYAAVLLQAMPAHPNTCGSQPLSPCLSI